MQAPRPSVAAVAVGGRGSFAVRRSLVRASPSAKEKKSSSLLSALSYCNSEQAMVPLLTYTPQR
jgi:hypothetical protein